MKFRSELPIKRWKESIHYHQKIMLIGSCFTEHMGNYLQDRKFTVLQNPNGILFNPISIAHAIQSYIHNIDYTQNDLFQFNDIWLSWNHHSRFSNINKEDCLQQINSAQQKAYNYLQKADWLIITLGSAFIYKLTAIAKENNALANKQIGEAVANCHKVPALWFERKLFSVEPILTVYSKLIQQLFQFNTNLKIIFTISPVRHLREGLIDNNRSKAVLIQVVHQLCEQFDKLYYFPAYELVIDDLRDYRFYAEDLAHPNYQATQYVWEKFVEMCINMESATLMHKIEEIRTAYLHKPLHPQTQQHQLFLKSYLSKLQLLKQQFPELDLNEEIKYFDKKNR